MAGYTGKFTLRVTPVLPIIAERPRPAAAFIVPMYIRDIARINAKKYILYSRVYESPIPRYVHIISQ